MIRKLLGLSAMISAALIATSSMAQPPTRVQRIRHVVRMSPTSHFMPRTAQATIHHARSTHVRLQRVRPMVRLPGMERIRYATQHAPVVRITIKRSHARRVTPIPGASQSGHRIVYSNNEQTSFIREHKVVDPIGAKRRKIRDKMKAAFAMAHGSEKKFPGKSVVRKLREDKKPEQN